MDPKALNDSPSLGSNQLPDWIRKHSVRDLSLGVSSAQVREMALLNLPELASVTQLAVVVGVSWSSSSSGRTPARRLH